MSWNEQEAHGHQGASQLPLVPDPVTILLHHLHGES